MFFEGAAKVMNTAEADAVGNLGERKIGKQQQCFSIFKPDRVEKFDGRIIGLLLENAAKMAGAETCHAGDILQRQWLLEVGVNMLFGANDRFHRIKRGMVAINIGFKLTGQQNEKLNQIGPHQFLPVRLFFDCFLEEVVQDLIELITVGDKGSFGLVFV